MNNNLKNFEIEPDPMVWNGIEKSLRQRTWLRRSAVACGVVVCTLATFLAFNGAHDDEVQLAQNLTPVTETATAKQATALQYSDSLEQTETLAVEQTTKANTPIATPTAEASQSTSAEERIDIDIYPEHPTTSTVAKSELATKVEETATAKTAIPQISEPIAVKEEVAQAVTATKTETPTAKAQTSSAASEKSILWIPNVFIPVDGDDEIRTFKVRSNEPVSDFRMNIFNRAGQRVFQSNDINHAWDGTYQGQLLSRASYVYVIQYTDKKGVKHQEKGTVTLVR